MQRAAAQLGIKPDVLQSNSAADYIPNLQHAAQSGDKLVIAVGFLMESAVEKVAAAFPNTNFAIIDSGPAKPISNLKSLLFHEQDGGYMAGYLAGLVTKTNVVSTVGGQKIPPVDHYIAGFIAGAQGRQPEGEGAERLLAELHQPGGVQGARAEPDLPALRRRLPGRGRLRPRRALGGQGEGRLGRRRGRRPGLPRLRSS